MLIRVHPPMTVLYVTRQTTLEESRELTANALRELYQYVADLDLPAADRGRLAAQ